jgi:peptide deformylase
LLTDQIIKHPNPILRERSEEADRHISEEVEKFLLDACQSDDNTAIVGLSSVQMDREGRVITYQDEEGYWQSLIDPVVYDRSEEHVWGIEGCGSLPGVHVHVRRPIEIQIKHKVKGLTQRLTLKEIPARIVLHEIDHLDGILIIDYGEPINEQRTFVLSDEERLGHTDLPRW